MTAIVFDFDGVLADSEPLHLRVYQQLLEPHGIHLDQATYSERYLGYDDEGVFQQIAEDYKLLLGDEEIEMLIEEKAQRFEKLVSSGDVLYPAAAACVRRLGAAWPLGIASGALRAEIELMLARRRAARRFQVHRLLGRHRARPSRRRIRTCARRSCTACRPRACVAIEDSHWGLESARAAGMRTIAITHTYPRATLTDADTIVDSLDELTVDFVEKLKAGSR